MKSTLFFSVLKWLQVICRLEWTPVPPVSATPHLPQLPKPHYLPLDFLFNFPNKIASYISDINPKNNNEELHSETLRRKSSESRQEERRGRKDENLVSGPFEKPQCLAKYHVWLLFYKETSPEVPFLHWKRKRSLVWPKLGAKTLRLRVWYPQNPSQGDLSTLLQMLSDLWSQVILLQSAPEQLFQHTLQESFLNCNFFFHATRNHREFWALALYFLSCQAWAQWQILTLRL